MNQPAASTQPIDLADESVAGEEDPGASLELPARPTAYALKDADPNPCPTCGGDGQLNGGPCPDCEGTGRMPESGR